MFKSRRVARNWATLVILLGVTISVGSVLVLKPNTPKQADFIKPPLAVEAEETIPELVPDQTSSSFLYPVYPKVNQKIGSITLPSLSLSWPIYEGTAEAQLARGVGHYLGSVLPGITDNSILSGHRSTVFNRIGELEIDDLIYVQTAAGLFIYKVTGFEIVDRSDETVIQPSEYSALTLTTCYPFNAIGKTTDAFLVRAILFRSYFD
jgi:sortase A